MRLALLSLLLTGCSGKGAPADDTAPAADGGDVTGDGSDGGTGDGGGDGGASTACVALTPRSEAEVRITTQAEVTSFCDSWNAVDGDLFVDVGSAEDTITELDGLDCLCEVTGDLTVTGDPDAAAPADPETSPPHVTGDIELPLLQKVGGDLVISHHPDVSYLLGLESLEEVGGDLVVSSNPELQVAGFYALRTVGGTVRVTDAEKLVILRLPAATSLGGIELGAPDDNVTLYYLVELLLDDLQEIRGNLRITGSRNLANLAAPSLTAIGGALDIEASCRLQFEFSALTDVGSLDLQGDCGLQDFEGLSALARVNSQDADGRSIHIEANDGLSSGEIDTFLAGLESTGTGTTAVSTDTSCVEVMAAYGEGYCE